MTYGYAPAPRKSGMRKAGKWMFIIGAVLSVLCIIAMIWGFMSGANLVRDLEQGGEDMPGGTLTVEMAQSDTRFVLAPSGTSPSCTVTTPEDTEQSLDTAMADPGADGESRLVGSYTATSAGEHTFACDEEAVSLSAALGASTAVSLLAAVFAVFGLILFGILTVIGLILWLVGRSRDKRAAQEPTGGYGYGQPGQYPQAGGYPQQGGYGQPGQRGGYPEQGGQTQGGDYDSGNPYGRPEDDRR